MAFDLVIRAGSVIDGTGAPAVTADVGIKDGKIMEIGRITALTRHSVNADGALVTPGFVDIHTHYDGQATWAERMSPSSNHGVTTVVMGNCGVGFAPVRTDDHNLLVELMEGVEEIPGAAMHEGLPWTWESFPQYLDFLATRRFDMDVGAQLPHAALRVYVMGMRGANREPATEQDIMAMSRLVTEAMQAGAIGFSSSRTLNHRSSKGAPTPSLTAERAELLGIAQGMKAAGRGVLEMISDFNDLDTEFANLEAMAAMAGRPMTVSLAQGLSPNGWRRILDRVEQANARGTTIRGQVAPRAIGLLVGLTNTTSPFTTRPSFMEVARLPFAEKLAALRDPVRKAKILAEEPSAGFARLYRLMAEGWKLWRVGDYPDYEPQPADSMAAEAEREGKDVWSLVYDTMTQGDGKAMFYVPFANYAEGNLDCCYDMLMHEYTVPGLGDGGAHVGTICDASFVTTLLSHWGRDRRRGQLIDLPTLVKRQTHDTARAVMLTDRGVLTTGMRADVNIIDFSNLRVGRPEMVRDLPAGGARLQQPAEGYVATVCNGEVTYQNGIATGALPGRLVRGR
jgi:N-acyl-D-aspartate/D-glutamate deacylase